MKSFFFIAALALLACAQDDGGIEVQEITGKVGDKLNLQLTADARADGESTFEWIQIEKEIGQTPDSYKYKGDQTNVEDDGSSTETFTIELVAATQPDTPDRINFVFGDIAKLDDAMEEMAAMPEGEKFFPSPTISAKKYSSVILTVTEE